MGHFEEAEASLRESLAMEQRLGVDETIQLQGLTNLADLLRTRKRPADAEPYAAQALEMARRLCKSDDSKLTYAMSTLASLRQELGRFSEAEPLLLEGIEVLQRRLSADHPDVIAAKRSLGVDYWKLRQFDKSVPLLEEVLAAHERAHGRADARTQNAVANLGVNYRDAGRLAEAIALLEESYQASKRLSGMEWVAAALRDAYDLALAAGGTVDTVRFVAFVEEWIASQRTRVPEESRELAGLLAQSSLTLLGQRQWDAAEPLARECLAIREKKEPEAWSTFNAESMLGGVLLGQKRFAEAEPLLIDGYRGMKSREAAIPPQGRPRMSESIERIVQLYEATGNATEAAKWRPELEALRAQASTPPAEKDKR
jgi:tetratricopeptide (TPR) repeat protein